MANKSKNKLNQPPTGEGKKQSSMSGREVEMDKRSEVLQAQRHHPELNQGTGEDREPAEREGMVNNPNRPKAGRWKMTVQTISRDELKGKLDRGDEFVLVETLAEEKYRHTHLPGAINLPPDRVAELAPTLIPDKAAEIVVYCASPSWHASENVARELATMGYANVKDYEGGKQDWIDAGLPVERYQRRTDRERGQSTS
jgi:rhodanese-related sulfurtransferase